MGGLITWFARSPVAAHALMGTLMIAGLYAAFNTPNVYLPTIEPRDVVVRVRYPGATVDQVETEILRRIEGAVGGIAGVERVVGVATPELGVVTIEARNFADPGEIRREADNAIRALDNFPPPNAHQPEVELRAPLIRAATVVVYSPSAGEAELRLAAEDLREKLWLIPEVLAVDLEGVRDREITVEVAPEQLLRHELSLHEVADAIRQASDNSGIGLIRAAGGVIKVESDQGRDIGAELLDIVLIEEPGGARVTVGDVADVRDGFVEERVTTSYRNADAALLHVTLRKGVSADDAVAAVGELIASSPLPEGLRMELWENTLSQQKTVMDGLLTAILTGFVIAWFFLLLVFDLRIAFWATVSIPLCIIASLALTALVGLEFSVFSYASFFIFIGVVVDDTIVVAEGVAAARSRGLRGTSAAIAGARAVARPVTLGVATTLMVLVPFLFITEPDFQLFITVAVVGFAILGVSLVEAFFILPRHLAGDRPWSRPPLTDIQRAVGRSLDRLRDAAVGLVNWSIRRLWTGAGVMALFALGVFALLQGGPGRISLSDAAGTYLDFVQLELELPIGSPHDVTAAVAERYADVAADINEALPGDAPVTAVTTMVGLALPWFPGVEPPTGSHLATVRAHLGSDRVVTSVRVAQVWQQLAGAMPEVEQAYFRAVGTGSSLDFNNSLQHQDPRILREAVKRARDFLEAMPGVVMVSDSMRPGTRQFDIELTPEGRAAGFAEVMVADELRARLRGIEVNRIQRGRDELAINVRYPPRSRASLSDLTKAMLPVPDENGLQLPVDPDGNMDRMLPVPEDLGTVLQPIVDVEGGWMRLSTAANLVETRAVHELMRIDGKPAATISARIDPEVIGMEALGQRFANELAPALLNDFPGLEIQAGGFARAATRTAQLIGSIFAITLLAMYVLLAVFQRSYWKPLLTLSGVPVCAVGAFLLHVLLGWTLNLVSVMGIIAVSGIVINDGIVLLDRYARLRGERPELSAAAAAKLAMALRFRAVLITSVTTIAALSPILYIANSFLTIVVPFGISMIGGSAFAVLFVLFVMPAVVAGVEGGADRRRSVGRVRPLAAD